MYSAFVLGTGDVIVLVWTAKEVWQSVHGEVDLESAAAVVCEANVLHKFRR